MTNLLRAVCAAVFLFCAINGRAADAIYSATITFTNNPADGNSLTINGKVWTFKTSVTDSTTQVQIGATLSDTAGNYFARIQTGPYPSIDSSFESPDKVHLNGLANFVITGSKVGTWGVLTITSTTLSGHPVSYPFSARLDRIAMANAILAGLTAYATNPVPATAPWLTNFVNLFGDQLVTGANVYSNANQLFILGVIDQASVTNAPFVVGTNVYVLGPLVVKNASPGVFWADSDAALTNQVVGMHFDDGTFRLLFWDGFISASNEVMTVTRSGLAPQIINFPRGTMTVAKLVSPDIEGILTNATAYLTNLFAKMIVAQQSMLVSNSAPDITFHDTDGSLDNKRIHLIASNGSLSVMVESDDGGTFSFPFQIHRTGNTVDYVYFGGPAGLTEAEGTLWVLGNSLLQGNATIQGIAGVGSTNLLAPAGMTSGILETNATSEPTADPANAGALYVNAGEWKARGVGDGVNWRLKNLSATSTGSGSDYNLTASYANAAFGVSVSLVLPSAGTYSVFGTVTVDEDVGNANDSISAKIFNATDSSDVAGSERTISCIPAGKRGEIVLFAPTLTVSSGKTLQVFVKNSTAARGSVASAQTSLSYVRLY